MISVGLLLGKQNTWEKRHFGAAVRTGMSTLGEVYTSVGPYMEGAITENHSVTWNAELAAGYWFREPHRARTDLLAAGWNGQNSSPLAAISEQYLLALRLGVQFYPVR